MQFTGIYTWSDYHSVSSMTVWSCCSSAFMAAIISFVANLPLMRILLLAALERPSKRLLRGQWALLFYSLILYLAIFSRRALTVRVPMRSAFRGVRSAVTSSSL